MMKSFPRPWYLTKWRARSDSRRSRNEAAAADLGVETAIEATARRGAPGPPRSGSRTRARNGAVGAATAAAAAKEVAAAAGDIATRAGAGSGSARGFGRSGGCGGSRSLSGISVRVMTRSLWVNAGGPIDKVWPAIIESMSGPTWMRQDFLRAAYGC